MFVEGKSRTIFFSSDTLIYGISRDGSKKFKIRTCEQMVLGQLTMGARQTKNAPLVVVSEGSDHKFILSQSEVSKNMDETIANCSGTFHSSAEVKFSLYTSSTSP